MARRMRKRARSSDAERGSRPKDKASKRKRLGQLDNSHQAVSHAVPSNDLRPIDLNDPSQFQTPYTSLHSSAAEQATVPDILSPLPVARRILSRTNSRNLKENKSKSTSSRHTHSRSTSRGDLVLASPFHSRPGSLTSSPKKKSHSKHSKYGKSRANSDNRNHEPTFTMNHQNQSTQNSPHHSVTNKRICHNRVPSGPTDMLPANLLFEQDWLVPAKALNRAPLGEISRHDDEFFDGNGSFFGDVPLAYSTPLQKASDPRLHADNNDVIMQEPNALPLSRQRKIVHENADSIFSSLYYSAEISDPGTESTSHRYPKKQSLLSNPVALSFPSSPFPSESDFLQVANNDDPVPDPAILAHPPWNQISHDPFAAGFDPVIATPPPSPPRSRIIMVEGSPNGDALGEMFGVLDIQGTHSHPCIFLCPYILLTTAYTHHSPFNRTSNLSSILLSRHLRPYRQPLKISGQPSHYHYYHSQQNKTSSPQKKSGINHPSIRLRLSASTSPVYSQKNSFRNHSTSRWEGNQF